MLSGEKNLEGPGGAYSVSLPLFPFPFPSLFLSLSLSLSLFLSLILTLDINPNGLMIILLLQPSEPRSGEHNVKNERSTLHIPRSHSSHMVAVYVCTHNHEQGFR